MGDESLDVDEVGIGLDGAENMGQDGERGEVGLGFGGLQDITTRKLVSTWGSHSRSMERAQEAGGGELEHSSPDTQAGGSAKSCFSRPDFHVSQVKPAQ